MAQSAISRFSKLQTDPLRNFRFIVDFRVSGDTQLASASYLNFKGGFTSVSGLSISNNAIGYREGGMNTTVHQVPGTTQFEPISLQRGVILGQSESINWMKQLFSVTSAEGIPSADGTSYRCDLDIYVLDHPMTSASGNNALIGPGDIISNKAYKMKFTVHNAWIQSLRFNDLSATDNSLLYETMTLVHEGLSVTLADYGQSVPSTLT
jgi:phage tail-like protein